jgi:phage N-6-adenine-methyltransferase
MSVHFSSARDDWRTPVGFLSELNLLKPPEFDPCPDPAAPDWVCAKHTPVGEDALQHPWPEGKHVFINPPYSVLSKGEWTDRILQHVFNHPGTSFLNHVTVLVPSRTDTKWWQALAEKASSVFFLKGRLKFHGAKNSAPFPSSVLCLGYTPNVKQWAEYFRAVPFKQAAND